MFLFPGSVSLHDPLSATLDPLPSPSKHLLLSGHFLSSGGGDRPKLVLSWPL
jgi:hypothetical protein